MINGTAFQYPALHCLFTIMTKHTKISTDPKAPMTITKTSIYQFNLPASVSYCSRFSCFDAFCIFLFISIIVFELLLSP